MTDEELEQMFANRFNCYADTTDDSVVMAMDCERFVEVVREILDKVNNNGKKDGLRS